MKNITILLILLTLTFSNVSAQKIKDGETVSLNGLSVTFNITNKESVTVGGKNFDRYKVSANLVNNSEKSFNIRLNASPQVASNTNLVELDCINATGAKLTSKKMELKLKAHNLNATYWYYNKEGKYVSGVLPVIAGYYLDPGDSVNNNAIFIVPQGETPDVLLRKI
ncbi:hypothetical protein [Flavobacterium sp. CFS9]